MNYELMRNSGLGVACMHDDDAAMMHGDGADDDV